MMEDTKSEKQSIDTSTMIMIISNNQLYFCLSEHHIDYHFRDLGNTVEIVGTSNIPRSKLLNIRDGIYQVNHITCKICGHIFLSPSPAIKCYGCANRGGGKK